MDRRALLGLAAVAAASASPVRASSGKSGGGAPADSYIRLPIVTASVMRANGQRGVFSVEAGVDVQDSALRLRASQSAPRLRAAFNTAVQRFALGLRPGQAPNVDQLSRDLQAAANTVMGRPGATVLLGTVMAI